MVFDCWFKIKAYFLRRYFQISGSGNAAYFGLGDGNRCRMVIDGYVTVKGSPGESFIGNLLGFYFDMTSHGMGLALLTGLIMLCFFLITQSLF